MFGGSRVKKRFKFSIETRRLSNLIMEVLPGELDKRLKGGEHTVETTDFVNFVVRNNHPRHPFFPHRVEIAIHEAEKEIEVMFLTNSRITDGALSALGLEGILRSYLEPDKACDAAA